MIKITSNISLQESELEFTFIRASGPGGQNVNKLATAAQLRFDVLRSPSLSEAMKRRLALLAGSKMTLQGELVIKASRFRTQERNKQDAFNRLKELLQKAAVTPKKRKKTKPTLASKKKRLTNKKIRSRTKVLRKVKTEE